MCWGPTASVGERPPDKNVGATPYSATPHDRRVFRWTETSMNSLCSGSAKAVRPKASFAREAHGVPDEERRMFCADSAEEPFDIRFLSGMYHPVMWTDNAERDTQGFSRKLAQRIGVRLAVVQSQARTLAERRNRQAAAGNVDGESSGTKPRMRRLQSCAPQFRCTRSGRPLRRNLYEG